MRQIEVLPCHKENKLLLKDNYLVSEKLYKMISSLSIKLYDLDLDYDIYELIRYINELSNYMRMSASSILFDSDNFSCDEVVKLLKMNELLN